MKRIGFSKLHKGFVRVAIFANVLGALVLFGQIGIMNFDVVAWGVFHASFRGVVEGMIFLIILMVYLQLPDVGCRGRLTRSAGFLGIMRNRNPRFPMVPSRRFDTVSAVLMGVIACPFWVAVDPFFIQTS